MTSTTILVLAAVFMLVIVGTLFGAISGWIVGLVFTPTFHTVMIALGMQTIEVWQLGAVWVSWVDFSATM